jgi:predicted TIM-barrel fold metal-dependent hydrolase
MNSAKAIAVAVTHEGSCWDYVEGILKKLVPRRLELRTLGVFSVIVLVAAGTYAVAPELSSVLFAEQGSKAEHGQSAVLKDFASIQPIDAHIHIYKDDPELNALIERLNLRALNICVIDDRDPFGKGLEPQRSDVLKVRQSTHGRAAFCTTFSPYDFEEPGFSERTIRQLNQDFSNGAVAVKIYKVMGMEMKSKAGKWVMADDPAFEPIYQDIAAHNRTLVAHLAEPDSCWQTPNPASPDYDYYKEHPEEYAYQHPDWPSKAAILAARDHLVAENPKLRVLGAHLGSMETNVDDIAQRLDHYPNFTVDMAARVPYFMLQRREKVRAFLIKYQDRVLYATDLVVMPQAKTVSALAEFRSTYERDWKFFSTDQTVEYMGKTYQGLALPRPVLKKLFHDNAVRWFPGLVALGKAGH